MRYSFTEEDLVYILDPLVTADEIKERFGCSKPTVNRLRKKLGWTGKPGSKKNKPKPWQTNGTNIPCRACGKDMYVTKKANTKYCSRSCMYGSEEYLNILKNIDRSYMQTEEYSATLRKESTLEYTKYSRRVHTLTARTYKLYEREINPLGLPRGVAGTPGAYHLDHKVPIKYGFANNISPEVIARKENLQILPWKENVKKSGTYYEE